MHLEGLFFYKHEDGLEREWWEWRHGDWLEVDHNSPKKWWETCLRLGQENWEKGTVSRDTEEVDSAGLGDQWDIGCARERGSKKIPKFPTYNTLKDGPVLFKIFFNTKRRAGQWGETH